MGKATRWLKSLLGGGKKQKESAGDGRGGGSDLREKRRWSFKSGRDSSDGPVPGVGGRGGNGNSAAAAGGPAWLRSYYEESEKEQSKHAIAVAAATAAAADAAVAAAQAAVVVVRLTSHGRGTLFSGGGGERWAAVKIQTAFRGYLARKALRALKALVKLQALVRGYLVRKQAAATLHSMQALIRAQASVRAQRSRALPVRDHSRFFPEAARPPRRSLERFDESRSEHTASFHSRRLSATLDQSFNGFDESPKIVEIDPGRPKSRNRRPINPSPSDSATTADDDTPPPQCHSSPLLPCHPPPRLTIPDRRNFQDPDWGLAGDECRFSTAQSTPRYLSAGGPPLFSGVVPPATPAKSVCAGMKYQGFSNHPNYMAKTLSFNAKVRSQSAPKQRPEPRRRMSLSEMVESRASLSGVRMQRSCSRAQEALSFKNTIVGRLDRCSDLGRGEASEKDYYLQRRW